MHTIERLETDLEIARRELELMRRSRDHWRERAEAARKTLEELAEGLKETQALLARIRFGDEPTEFYAGTHDDPEKTVEGWRRDGSQR